jgi:hypothetical protein
VNFRQLMQIVEREIGSAESARVAEAICRDAAGERIYIPERPGPPIIAAGASPVEVARQFGVHRNTASAWVRRYSR